MNILLTNDDGIYALGLRAIYSALCEAGHNVQVVAPMTEQSAVGHSLTIFQPLRIKEIQEVGFSGVGVYGTPTDCVKFALSTFLENKPDLIISGINAGANVGPDILYSGTVAAATEGAHNGLRSLALSYDNLRPTNLTDQAQHAAKFVQDFDWQSVPQRCVLNINYPNLDVSKCRGMRVCPQTTALWNDSYTKNLTPRGDSYWWIKGEIRTEDVEENTDRDLLSKGYITLTPLRFNFTHEEFLENLKNIAL